MTSSRGGAVVYSKKWSKIYFLTAVAAGVVFQISLRGLGLLRRL
jgi:hypothetical protein